LIDNLEYRDNLPKCVSVTLKVLPALLLQIKSGSLGHGKIQCTVLLNKCDSSLCYISHWLPFMKTMWILQKPVESVCAQLNAILTNLNAKRFKLAA